MENFGVQQNVSCTVGNWEIENDHKENEGTEASKSGLERKLFVLPRGSQSRLKTDINSQETIVTPKRKLKAMFIQNFVGKTKLHCGERESRK